MENLKMTEAQSLEMISQMINDSRHRLARNSGTPFLIWGYITVLVSLFEFFVVYFDLSKVLLFGWFAIPVLGWLLMTLFCRKNDREKGGRNYLDRVVSAIWVVFGVSFVWLYLAALIYQIPLLFLVVLMMGMGTLITGLVISDKATMWGGFMGMLTSLIFPAIDRMMPDLWFGWDILIFAVIFLVMMVIPGHILNAKFNK